MSRAYKYSALAAKTIRILSLKAGSPGDDLSSELQSYDLGQLPSFSALSYCWGDPDRAQDCFCEETSSGGRIRISRTLSSALQQLRKTNESISVWADQICIDQDNDDEKKEQVRLMGSIYGRASDVIVWLGEADDDTAMLFQHIQEVDNQVAHLMRTLGPDRAHNPQNPHAAHYPLQLSPGNAREWIAFRRLFRRPWFSRVWTFQELALSNTAIVRCGPASIDWDRLFLMSAVVSAYDRQNLAAVSRLDGSSRICQHMSQCRASRRGARFELLSEAKDQLRLLDLVFNLMKRKTSLPHDKIYGLLAVAEDIDTASIPIDYTQHFRDAYAQMTKFFILHHADLSVLSLASVGVVTSPPQQGPRNLPSWVPDYRFDRSHDTNLRLHNGPKVIPHGEKRLYNATGSTTASLYDSVSPLKLSLQGVLVGRVDAVSEMDGNTYTSELLKLGENVLTGGSWSQFAATCATGGIYLHTREPIEQAFARLRTGDYLPGEATAQHRHSRTTSGPIPEPQPNVNMFEQDDAIGRTIMSATHGQRMFVTDSGYIGLAHAKVTVGDEVYLLMGGHMPFILRRLVHGPFCFLGESYVHGIMDGEYLVKRFKTSDVSGQDWLDGLDGTWAKELKTEAVVLS